MPPGLRVTGIRLTIREMVCIDLLIDADFTGEYTAALPIPGKSEYSSS